MKQINIVEGEGLDILWFNLVNDICCGDGVQYNYPYIFKRLTYGSAEKIKLVSQDGCIVRDFFHYSKYSYKMKMSKLEHDYFDDRVQAQLGILKTNLKDFHPKQARGVVYFSRDPYDKTAKLKCLDSLYFLKTTMSDFSAQLVFRNTEVLPKLFMDFLLIRKIIKEVEKTSKCRCFELNCIIMNSFITIGWAGTIALFLRQYGITAWNPQFKHMLELFKEKYSDINVVKEIKMQSIKRTLLRFHDLLKESGLSIKDL